MNSAKNDRSGEKIAEPGQYSICVRRAGDAGKGKEAGRRQKGCGIQEAEERQEGVRKAAECRKQERGRSARVRLWMQEEGKRQVGASKAVDAGREKEVGRRK